MENYKIRVENEAGSKEVQELLEKLGFKKFVWGVYLDYFIFANSNYYSRDCISNFTECDYKEITIPELRDLVVLKRNDVSDKNVTDGTIHDLYQSSNGTVFFYHHHKKKWIESEINKSANYMADVKPITKEPVMKEYLNKLTDGTYKLVVLSDVIDGHDGLIEIPEGADIYAISENWNDNIFFARTGGDTLETFNTINKNDWHRESTLTLENLENRYSILWQRHTQPEELPFVDDEQKYHVNNNSPMAGRPLIINNTYAEIKQVRQASITDTLNERQSTYGDFKDVANTTQYLLRMLSTDAMSDVQLEALHMICSKLARIAHGDPNYKDNWHDIAGYATLVERSL